MWLLNWLPDWLFYAIGLIGVIGLVSTSLLRFIPIPAIYMYKTPIQLVSVVLIAFATYMAGGIANEQAWRERVAKLEKEYNESQVKSEKATTEVVTKYITKREKVVEKGEEVIRYIDREITKYNEICRLPKEAIQAHNDAAKGPK